jgi:hypothetical protein
MTEDLKKFIEYFDSINAPGHTEVDIKVYADKGFCTLSVRLDTLRSLVGRGNVFE